MNSDEKWKLAAALFVLLISLVAVIVYQDGQRSQGNPSYSELNKYQSNYDYDQSIDRSAPYREAEVEEVESLFEGAPADIKEIVSGIEKGLRENPDNSELIAR